MTTFNVDGAAGFAKAVKAAHAGDTIALAAGTYSGLQIENLNLPGAITITSRDPAHQAILTGLTVKSSSGLNFSNLEFVVDGAKPEPTFRVGGSHGITFDHLNIHGSLDGNAANDGAALVIYQSQGVTISHTEAQQLKNLVVKGASDQVNLVDNNVHDLAGDTVRTIAPQATVPVAKPPVVKPPEVVHVEPKVIEAKAAGGLLEGTANNDVIKGGKGADEIHAKAGNDLVTGGAGNDSLFGEAGNDTLVGGDGNDLLVGGNGLNAMTGGGGADTFAFRAGDFEGGLAKNSALITDFSHNQGDRLDLSGIDANTTLDGDNAFKLIGGDAFHHVAGELRYEASGNNLTLLGDTDGDGLADVRIVLTGGVSGLKAADILL